MTPYTRAYDRVDQMATTIKQEIKLAQERGDDQMAIYYGSLLCMCHTLSNFFYDLQREEEVREKVESIPKDFI